MSDSLLAISPIDGRYANKTSELSPFFSEKGLIKYRLIVEIRYIQFLKRIGISQVQGISDDVLNRLEKRIQELSHDDAAEIKRIEATTNHDVKAVEYFIKNILQQEGQQDYVEFVHFGLTSQDINNTAIPLSFKEALAQVIYPELFNLIDELKRFAKAEINKPMLARTHGQPASPTLLGKEIAVFNTRLENQLSMMYAIPFACKFGGATGNLNAHFLAYPDYDWHALARQFVEDVLGQTRSYPTTQIEHYDMLAAHCHAFVRINTILIDLCRDFWAYISMNYFTQKVVKDEVGSSAMPHKVNPIDFENAEGNLGLSNAIFNHLALKLPISRLQRDLTDSTVLRNIGVPMAHTLIALKSLRKGLGKIHVNSQALKADLDRNWAVLAEAIQTVLRREGIDKPYEKLKELSRGNENIDRSVIHNFIKTMDVSEQIKNELLALTPGSYTGRS